MQSYLTSYVNSNKVKLLLINKIKIINYNIF
jgi:hypothetical protein